MSDAAVKVDPDFYNRRLLESDDNVDLSRRAFPASGSSLSGGGGGGGGIGMRAGRDGGGGGGYGRPDLLDYLVRQHSLLGLYLSLNPGDEADAERNWDLPHPQRAAVAGATVVVPLFLAIFLTGSWLWKASVIGVVTVGVRLGLCFALRTFPDVELPVQGYSLGVWPHLTLGVMTLLALIWFVTAAASGTGWSTLLLCLTSLLWLTFVEAALRGGMWHFEWWVPAEHLQFLKPWGDYDRSSARGKHPPRESSYAPPRPMPEPQQPLRPTGGAVGGMEEDWGTNGGGGGGGGDALGEQTAFLEGNGHGLDGSHGVDDRLEDGQELDELLKESV